MADKKIKTRIQQKHDIEVNWITAGEKGFIPMAGEVIVYDVDDTFNYTRVKMGDGVTNVTDLPFLTQSIKWVTHAELKALRDNSQLIPGVFYRITDYDCQVQKPADFDKFDFTSAHHKFDIIVQALSTNTLSEDAKADYHYGENGILDYHFVTKKPGIYIEPRYVIMTDEEGELSQNDDYLNTSDIFIAVDYVENPDGEVVPVLYKTDMSNYPAEADYDDIHYYAGTYEVDGVTYDSWRKFDEAFSWDSDQQKYILTDIIINNGTFIDAIFGEDTLQKRANIPAWELKYCLDNDTDRFSWAVGPSALKVEDPWGNSAIFVRYPAGDYSGRLCWATLNGSYQDFADVEDWTDLLSYETIYTTTTDIKPGTSINFSMGGFDFVVTEEPYSYGKGVIYYMKDEWNNECPYDFKNILFYRDNYYNALYTFSWINEDGYVEELTAKGGLNGYDKVYYPHNNKISNCWAIVNQANKLILNNIVFINHFDWDEGCLSSCEDNSFALGCHSMTFNDHCTGNTFGVECANNYFGPSCCNNTFGNSCTGNSFERNSDRNIFENYCSNNSLTIYCNENIFKTFCTNITLIEKCSSNVFGANCSHIVIRPSRTYWQSLCLQNSYIAESCKFINILCNEKFPKHVIIGPGISGTLNKYLDITPESYATYERSGATHIMVDIEE